MEYKEFLEALKKGLEEYFGESREVKRWEVTKVNLGKLDVLLISPKEENVSCATPTFYVRTYYHQYQDGKTMDELVQDIAELYEMHSDDTDIGNLTKFFRSYEKVRDKIYFRLVNARKNQLMLKNIPHIEYLDLAMFFQILAVNGADGIASMRITNEMLENWGVSLEELHRHAIENTERLFPARIEDLESAILRIMCDCEALSKVEAEVDEIWENRKWKPVLLSNQKGINGFSTILYRDCLKDLAKRMNHNLFIVPSSVHEALIFPATEDKQQIQELQKLLRNVNASEVSEEDFMSDEVYYYNLEKDILEITRGDESYV